MPTDYFLGEDSAGVQPHTQAEPSGAKYLAGMLAVAVMSVFLIFIHNRYLPIHEGWFSNYGYLMRQGKVPYRDFYFFTQPLSLFISELFVGDHLINLRRFGLVERIVLSGMLYFLLSRRFSAMASFWATITSLMFFGTYISDALFTYLVDSFVALVGGMICVYQAYAHPKHERTLFFSAGVCASLSFFLKQSTGLFASVGLALVIAWLSDSRRRALWRLGAFSTGWWVTAAPIIIWLIANGAWQPYLAQVYKGAAASKAGGSLALALFGLFGRSMSPTAIVIFAIFALLTGYLVRAGAVTFRKPDDAPAVIGKAGMAWASLIALAAVMLPVFSRLPMFSKNDTLFVFLGRMILLLLSRLFFYAMLVALVWACVRRIRSSPSPRERVPIILIVGGCMWAYGSGLSWMVEQQAVILGVACFTAMAYDSLSSRQRISRAPRVAAACLLLATFCAWMKFNNSFDWHGWRASVSLTPASSRWPQLSGYRVDQATAEMYDTILDDVIQYSKPGEPIFTFQSIPMFNWITGRPQPTFCPVHYFDVCPDDQTVADAKRVRAAKPALLIYMSFPEKLWKGQEEGFRGGKPSGQREMQLAIDDLIASGDYIHLHSFRPWYPPGSHGEDRPAQPGEPINRNFPAGWYTYPIDVWARVHRDAKDQSSLRP